MSKRLLRLFPPFGQDSLSPLLALDINVILRDDRTVFGRLETIDSDFLLIRDSRSHPHQMRLADVAEIIYDQKSVIFPKIAEPL